MCLQKPVLESFKFNVGEVQKGPKGTTESKIFDQHYNILKTVFFLGGTRYIAGLVNPLAVAVGIYGPLKAGF